jgi:hypothetical protein
MLRRALLAGLICATGVAAQHLRLGLVGGAGLTPDYIRTYFPGRQIVLPDGTVLTFPELVRQSAGRTAIGGPLLEWSFYSNLSVEGNAIYRRLRLAGVGPTVTWQFPILLKYRFPLGQFGLFVEGGPSLRTTGNRNANPSHIGVSGGAGLDWQAGAVRLSPTLRYTRWARDVAWTVPSKPDQLELLLAITGDAPSDRHPLGRRVRLGAAANRVRARTLPSLCRRGTIVSSAARRWRERGDNRCIRRRRSAARLAQPRVRKRLAILALGSVPVQERRDRSELLSPQPAGSRLRLDVLKRNAR